MLKLKKLTLLLTTSMLILPQLILTIFQAGSSILQQLGDNTPSIYYLSDERITRNIWSEPKSLFCGVNPESDIIGYFAETTDTFIIVYNSATLEVTLSTVDFGTRSLVLKKKFVLSQNSIILGVVFVAFDSFKMSLPQIRVYFSVDGNSLKYLDLPTGDISNSKLTIDSARKADLRTYTIVSPPRSSWSSYPPNSSLVCFSPTSTIAYLPSCLLLTPPDELYQRPIETLLPLNMQGKEFLSGRDLRIYPIERTTEARRFAFWLLFIKSDSNKWIECTIQESNLDSSLSQPSEPAQILPQQAVNCRDSLASGDTLYPTYKSSENITTVTINAVTLSDGTGNVQRYRWTFANNTEDGLINRTDEFRVEEPAEKFLPLGQPYTVEAMKKTQEVYSYIAGSDRLAVLEVDKLDMGFLFRYFYYPESFKRVLKNLALTNVGFTVLIQDTRGCGQIFGEMPRVQIKLSTTGLANNTNIVVDRRAFTVLNGTFTTEKVNILISYDQPKQPFAIPTLPALISVNGNDAHLKIPVMDHFYTKVDINEGQVSWFLTTTKLSIQLVDGQGTTTDVDAGSSFILTDMQRMVDFKTVTAYHSCSLIPSSATVLCSTVTASKFAFMTINEVVYSNIVDQSTPSPVLIAVVRDSSNLPSLIIYRFSSKKTSVTSLVNLGPSALILDITVFGDKLFILFQEQTGDVSSMQYSIARPQVSATKVHYGTGLGGEKIKSAKFVETAEYGLLVYLPTYSNEAVFRRSDSNSVIIKSQGEVKTSCGFSLFIDNNDQLIYNGKGQASAKWCTQSGLVATSTGGIRLVNDNFIRVWTTTELTNPKLRIETPYGDIISSNQGLFFAKIQNEYSIKYSDSTISLNILPGQILSLNTGKVLTQLPSLQLDLYGPEHTRSDLSYKIRAFQQTGNLEGFEVNSPNPSATVQKRFTFSQEAWLEDYPSLKVEDLLTSTLDDKEVYLLRDVDTGTTFIQYLDCPPLPLEPAYKMPFELFSILPGGATFRSDDSAYKIVCIGGVNTVSLIRKIQKGVEYGEYIDYFTTFDSYRQILSLKGLKSAAWVERVESYAVLPLPGNGSKTLVYGITGAGAEAFGYLVSPLDKATPADRFEFPIPISNQPAYTSLDCMFPDFTVDPSLISCVFTGPVSAFVNYTISYVNKRLEVKNWATLGVPNRGKAYAVKSTIGVDGKGNLFVVQLTSPPSLLYYLVSCDNGTNWRPISGTMTIYDLRAEGLINPIPRTNGKGEVVLFHPGITPRVYWTLEPKVTASNLTVSDWDNSYVYIVSNGDTITRSFRDIVGDSDIIPPTPVDPDGENEKKKQKRKLANLYIIIGLATFFGLIAVISFVYRKSVERKTHTYAGEPLAAQDDHNTSASVGRVRDEEEIPA